MNDRDLEGSKIRVQVAELERRGAEEAEGAAEAAAEAERRQWRVWGGSGALIPALQRKAQALQIPADRRRALLAACQLADDAPAGVAVLADVREACFRNRHGGSLADPRETFPEIAKLARALARKLDAAIALPFEPARFGLFSLWLHHADVYQSPEEIRAVIAVLPRVADLFAAAAPTTARQVGRPARWRATETTAELLQIFEGALAAALRCAPARFVGGARAHKCAWPLTAGELERAERGWARAWKAGRGSFLREAFSLIGDVPSKRVLDAMTCEARSSTAPPLFPADIGGNRTENPL